MKKYPHQQFIEDNAIALDTLPKMLKKRIEGFEELEEDLEHTTEHDREQLVSKLELLSHEIAEDLEEQFEDQLENNDEEEDEPAEIETTVDEETPMQTEETKNIAELPPVLTNAEAVHTIANDSVGIENDQPLSGDEAVLKQLYLTKKLTVSPVQLIQKGFKAKLDDKIIRVGKYALYRGKYDTCYQLLLTEK